MGGLNSQGCFSSYFEQGFRINLASVFDKKLTFKSNGLFGCKNFHLSFLLKGRNGVKGWLCLGD